MFRSYVRVPRIVRRQERARTRGHGTRERGGRLESPADSYIDTPDGLLWLKGALAKRGFPSLRGLSLSRGFSSLRVT